MVAAISPVNGATEVSPLLSQLNFTLTDLQSNIMNYTVTTVPNIGSDTGNNVGDGVKTVSVSGLTSGTKYVWQVDVTDDELVFTVGKPGAASVA